MLRQAADLGGAAGLTFLLLLVNEAVAAAIGRRDRGWRAAAQPLALAVAAVAGAAAYGFMRLSTLQARPADDAAWLRCG